MMDGLPQQNVFILLLSILFTDDFPGIILLYSVTNYFRDFATNISMGECNTILSAYTKYRHLG